MTNQRNHPKRYHPSVRAKAVELYVQDVPMAEIVRVVDAPAATIYSWAQCAGARRTATRRHRWDSATKSNALTLYAAGVEVRQIAAKTGVRPHEIRRWGRSNAASREARASACTACFRESATTPPSMKRSGKS